MVSLLKSIIRAGFFATPVLAVSGEVPAVFNLDEDLGSGSDVVPADYKQIFVTPAVRLNVFPYTAVSPWVSFGGGFGHFSENKTLNYYGTNPGGSTTSGVLQGGFGLDVKSLYQALAAPGLSRGSPRFLVRHS